MVKKLEDLCANGGGGYLCTGMESDKRALAPEDFVHIFPHCPMWASVCHPVRTDTDPRRALCDRLTQTTDLAWGQCVADGDRNEVVDGRGEVHILLLQPHCHANEV